MQVREASFPQAPGRRRLRATSTAPSSFILPWGHGDSEGQPRCDPAHPPSTPQFSSQPKPVPGRASPPLPIISSSSSTTLIPFIPGMSWVSFARKPLRAQEPFPQGRCLVPLHVAPGTRPRGDTAAVPGTARSKPGSKQGQPPTPRAGPATLPKNTENRDQEWSWAVQGHQQGLTTSQDSRTRPQLKARSSQGSSTLTQPPLRRFSRTGTTPATRFEVTQSLEEDEGTRGWVPHPPAEPSASPHLLTYRRTR